MAHLESGGGGALPPRTADCKASIIDCGYLVGLKHFLKNIIC